MSEKIPGPAYRILTRRLVIRCYQPEDAPLLKAAVDASIDHLRPWMPWAADKPEDLQKELERIRVFRGHFDLNQDFIYGIFNQEQTRLLGGTGLHTRVGEDAREIGYWIHVDFINQGLATETSAALTRVAFEIDQVRRVEIHCDPENLPSATVPRKLGYTHEATLRQRSGPFADGHFVDSMIWSLLASDYPASPSAQADIQAFDAMGRQIL